MKAILLGKEKIILVKKVCNNCDSSLLFAKVYGYRDKKTNTIYKPDDLSFDQDEIKKIEMWEQRRYEVAKEILASYFVDPRSNPERKEAYVGEVIDIADELIKQLKEK